MTSIKFLFIFLQLWTFFLDLEFAAAATSTTRKSSIRPSRRPTARSNHQKGMIEVFEPQAAAKIQRAEFHPRRPQETNIAEKPLDRETPEFSDGGGQYDVGNSSDIGNTISVKNQKLEDNEKEKYDGAILVELDQPQIKRSTAKTSSSTHINNLSGQSNLVEAGKLLIPQFMTSESEDQGLDANNDNDAAGHTKLKKQVRKKKLTAGSTQILKNGQADADSHSARPADASKDDTLGLYHDQSAERRQTTEDFESALRSTATSPAAAQIKNPDFNYDAMNRTSQGAGLKDNGFSDKAKADAAKVEVVLTEERDEDKKLIPDYNLGEPIEDWNKERQEWARQHPEVKQEQLFILTGTQPWPCLNAEGDHLLLRCFKNKVDYSRIHGIGLFYNTALLDPHMPSFWAKLPVVRATMLAHPEVEWIWWLDADAIITDMEFSIPLHRYAAYNLVVHGWESLVFEKRSWLGLNAGSFLLRNCQWSLELLERWASMGPKAPMGDAYRHILSDFLPDRDRNPTDDQAALVFLLIKERQRWAGKLRVELDFFLSGYWLELMDGFEAVEERYRAMEEQYAELWQLLERHGAVGKEKLVAAVGRAREQHLRASGITVQQRRAFITHFTGCQPCSGHHNHIYSTDQCRTGLLRALNYADDQVLRTLGYQHRALHLPDVLPAPPNISRTTST